MKKELSKIYNPENLEEKWFKTWNSKKLLSKWVNF